MGAMFYEDGALLNEPRGMTQDEADALLLEGESLMELMAERQGWRDHETIETIQDRLIEIEDELSEEGYPVPSW